MHPFLRKILDATHLTRTGKLAEATAVIQRALASHAEAGAHSTAAWPAAVDAVVIDASPSETKGESPRVRSSDAVSARDQGIDVVDRASTIDEPTVDLSNAPESNVVEEPTVADPATRRRPPAGPGRFVDSSYTGAAGTRSFKLFLPDGYDGEALPLIVMLHGCTQDPDDFAAGTRMNELAQEHGFVVLYPAQAPRSNAHRCWNWFSPQHQRRGAGEPALLAGMTRHILQTHSIDHERVYVAGLSAGGAMAAILAREYPDLFAAAGVHSGIAAGGAHDVASAFAVMQSGPSATSAAARRGNADAGAAAPAAAPVIVFHGEADRTVAPANGHAVVTAALGNADAVATTRESGGDGAERAFVHTVWHRADGDDGAPSVAEHWVVRSAPHAWSGGARGGSYTDPAGPDASREMVRFFLEHPRGA